MKKIFKKISLGLSIFMLVLNLSSNTIYAAVEPDAPEVKTAVESSINFQESEQQADGSISGYGGETEWQIIANKTYEQATGETLASTAPMVESIKDDSLDATTSTTEVERKILAIEATGEDSSNFGGKDYKAELQSRYNNNQIGDQILLNDDYFGLMAIDAMQATDMINIAQDSLNFIVANQQADGGFSYTTESCAWCGSDSNDTSAAIQAIYSALNLNLSHANLETCRINAINYLLSTQNSDGGFGYDIYSDSDGSSTAWALMALNLVGDSVKTNSDAARMWLLAHQNPDGGFSYGLYGITNSDTYTTAQAAIALLGTGWVINPAPTDFIAPTPIVPQPSPINYDLSGSISALSLNQITSQGTSSANSGSINPFKFSASTIGDILEDGITFYGADKSDIKSDIVASSQPKSQNKAGLIWQISGILSLITLAGGWFIITKKNKKEDN